MHFAYVDESGDSGAPGKGGSKTYTLGCVLVPADKWSGALDDFIRYRRSVKTAFGVPLRAEIKANYLVSGRSSCAGLPSGFRYRIYRGHLRMVPKIGAQAFAVVIDKRPDVNSWVGCNDRAWTRLLERLEAFSRHNTSDIVLVHDEGDAGFVNRKARKARRFSMVGSMYGGSALSRPFTRLIEDPVPRNSAQSFFLQLADMVAFSAFRTVVPPPPGRPPVVAAFSELGASIVTEVNRYRPGQTPGVLLA